jgi:hypothetical protein
MRKSLSFSLLLLALALTVGCGDDKKKDVELSITPTAVTVETGKSVLLNAVAKNTEITLPVGVPGTYAQVGRLAVNYTAPAEPGTYDFTVTASNDKSKTATTKITVIWASPTILLTPATPTIVQGAEQQFTATVTVVPGAPAASAPTYSVTGGIGTIDAATGLFTAGATFVGKGTVVASLNYGGKTVSTSTEVTIVEPSKVFSWVKTVPDVIAATARPWKSGSNVAVNFLSSTYAPVQVLYDAAGTQVTSSSIIENPAPLPTPPAALTTASPDCYTSAFGGNTCPALTDAVSVGNFTIGVFEMNAGTFPPTAKISVAKWNTGTGAVLAGPSPVATYSFSTSNYQNYNQAKIKVSEDNSTFMVGFNNTAGKMAIRQLDPDTLALTGATTTWSGTEDNHFSDLLLKDSNNYIAIGAHTVKGEADTYGSIPDNPFAALAIVNTAGKKTEELISEITGLTTFSISYVIRDTDGTLIIVGTGTVADAAVGFVAKTTGASFVID